METNSTTSSSTDNQSKEVIIKLSESTYAHYFKSGTRVHESEYCRVFKMIEQQLKKAIDTKTTDEEKPYGLIRHHNTISIFGGRGSGKTSFLHTVFSECAEKYAKQIEMLKIVDPTLIETKGHVFLWIISLINEKVEARLKKEETNRLSSEYDRRKEWKDAVHQLARGLHSLENVGVGMKNEHWHDDYFVVESGLAQVDGALNLEANFRKMVDMALSILDKKAFLIAFDDIDVDMEKGWPVMETIRKYLTTDKIIVLLSGNLKLYSLNVRKHQWEQLQELQGWEKEKDFKIVVSEIEGQYLMKLLKAENRIFLHSIQDNIRSGKYLYKVKWDELEKEEMLTNVYKKALAELGIISRSQSNIYSNYLLSLSVRSQVHFLRGIDIITGGSYQVKNKVDSFMARMYAANIDIDYAINNPQMMNIVTLKYLLTQNLDLYLLMPTVEDEDANGCVTGLSFLFAKKVKQNPFLIFDYFIRIGYLRNILNAYEESSLKQKFCAYSGMYQDMSLKNIVGLSIAYSTAHKMNAKMHFPLYGFSIKTKKAATRNRIDDMLHIANLTDAQRMISLIPLCSIKNASSNNSNLYYSTINLLAAIGQVLRCIYSPLNEEKTDFVNDILRELKDMQIHRYYAQPQELENGNNAEDNIADFKLEFEQNFDKTTETLASLFLEWGKNEKMSPASIPPYLLGKIITRYMNAVPKITINNLGGRMHYALISLLNACLIEETKEYYELAFEEQRTEQNETPFSIDKLNFSNTIESDKIFLDNLQFVHDNDITKYTKLTKWLISCPLITPFLEGKSLKKYYELLGINIKESYYHELTKDTLSVYEPLRNVLIKENINIPFKVNNLDLIEEFFINSNNEEALEFIKEKEVNEIQKYLKTFKVFTALTNKNIMAVRTALITK